MGPCRGCMKPWKSKASSSRSVTSSWVEQGEPEPMPGGCVPGWDGTSSGQLGKFPLWWGSKPSPWIRHRPMEAGAGQASGVTGAAGKVTIKHLCHGTGGGSKDGGTNLPVRKDARHIEPSLLHLLQMDFLSDHDCTEKAPEQQILPLKPSSELKIHQQSPPKTLAVHDFLKADMQTSTEMTFERCKMRWVSFGGAD